MDTLDAGPEDARARQFGRARRRLFLASALVTVLAPLSAWLSGLSALAWQTLSASMRPWAATTLFVACALLAMALFLLPFGYLGSWALPRRYGLSHQGLFDWCRDWVRATLLGLGRGLVVALAFYGTMELLGPAWWVLFGPLAALGCVTLVFLLPYVVVPLFFRPHPISDPAVTRRIRSLFDAARTRLAAVVVLDFSRRTPMANAAVVGLGPSRQVVLSDTLLAGFAPEEIDGVVAHELGHHALGHVVRLVCVQVLSALGGVALAALVGEQIVRALGASGLADRSALPLLIVAGEVYSLLLLPFANALSRRLERQADEFAWHLTGRPRALAAALRRLGAVNLVEWQPPRWAVLLLATHPPLAERVAAAVAAFEAAA